jgi:hypothetical protein
MGMQGMSGLITLETQPIVLRCRLRICCTCDYPYYVYKPPLT